MDIKIILVITHPKSILIANFQILYTKINSIISIFQTKNSISSNSHFESIL